MRLHAAAAAATYATLAVATAFAPRPRRAAPNRGAGRGERVARFAGADELVLSEDSVETVLAGAREDLAACFGYVDESRRVGITGTVDFVEIDGPTVVVRFGGRFWHKRSDVLQRVANYLQERIPEICDVSVEDAAQLDDADAVQEKTNW